MAAELGCARGNDPGGHGPAGGRGLRGGAGGVGPLGRDNLPDEMLVSPKAAGRRSPTSPGTPVLSRRTSAALAAQTIEQSFDDSPIAFPTGQPDRAAFPYALWAKLLEREWRQPPWAIAGALHPFGHPGLRDAIASYLGMARGFRCEASAVVVTIGHAPEPVAFRAAGPRRRPGGVDRGAGLRRHARGDGDGRG